MLDLSYRDLNAGDFDVVHAMASDWGTVRQLGSWPWPSDPAHSLSRCKPYAGEGFVWAICLGGTMCGTVAVTGTELGYCLLPSYAGRGIISQAAAHAIAHAFQTRDLAQIDAAVWADNIASQRVLAKRGFAHWQTIYERSKPRRCPTLSHYYRLTRADWMA